MIDKIKQIEISAKEKINAAKNSSGGWFLKYVCITNEYSIEAIANAISALIGEKITMIQLNCGFDRAAHLILQN